MSGLVHLFSFQGDDKMNKILMFLCAVLIFFGIVSCPSPDNLANKESFSTQVTTADGSSIGDQSLATSEPATLLLLGTGLVVLAMIGRKKFKK